MMNLGRTGAALTAILAVSVTLAGCASSGVSPNSYAATENITPIQNTPVASTNLPPPGTTGSASTMIGMQGGQNTLGVTGGAGTDTAMLNAPAPLNPGMAAGPTDLTGQSGDPLLAPQVASNDGSFVTLGAVGDVPNTPGRDLSSGLTIEKLLGGWTVVAGAEQCKLNLTYTAKTGTARYRASTPGCMLQGLNVVASWQLVGSEVQLFDENNDIVASLILSGNRFIGTLAGGTGISMVG